MQGLPIHVCDNETVLHGKEYFLPVRRSSVSPNSQMMTLRKKGQSRPAGIARQGHCFGTFFLSVLSKIHTYSTLSSALEHQIEHAN